MLNSYGKSNTYGKSGSVFTSDSFVFSKYLPGFDTILVGSFFNPPGPKAPATRAFLGNFAK